MNDKLVSSKLLGVWINWCSGADKHATLARKSPGSYWEVLQDSSFLAGYRAKRRVQEIPLRTDRNVASLTKSQKGKVWMKGGRYLYDWQQAKDGRWYGFASSIVWVGVILSSQVEIWEPWQILALSHSIPHRVTFRYHPLWKQSQKNLKFAKAFLPIMGLLFPICVEGGILKHNYAMDW